MPNNGGRNGKALSLFVIAWQLNELTEENQNAFGLNDNGLALYDRHTISHFTAPAFAFTVQRG